MSRALQFELRLAERMSRLGTETAFEVLNRARALEREGKDIIHLEIGEPDFDTPQNVIEAGVEAMRGGWTHYGPPLGQNAEALPVVPRIPARPSADRISSRRMTHLHDVRAVVPFDEVDRSGRSPFSYS